MKASNKIKFLFNTLKNKFIQNSLGNFFYQLVKSYIQYDVDAHAAQVSFFTLSSYVPYLLFLLYLLQFTPITQTQIISIINMMVPETFSSFLNEWVIQAYQMSNGWVISIIYALWSSSKAFTGMISCLHKIYSFDKNSKKYKKSPGFIRILFNFTQRTAAIFYTLIFSLLIISTLLVLVYGSSIIRFINHKLHIPTDFISSLIPFGPIIAFVILSLFFFVLYFGTAHLRHFKNKILPFIVSAVFTSSCWLLFSYIYSYFLEHFSRMSLLYGGLSAFVSLTVWIDIEFNFLFIGAILSKNLSDS